MLHLKQVNNRKTIFENVRSVKDNFGFYLHAKAIVLGKNNSIIPIERV